MVNKLFTGLRSAIYPVADIEAARDWYAALFGIAPYFDNAFYVGFSIGGFEFGLMKSDKTATAGVNAMWAVENIDDGVAQVLAAGGVLIDDIADVGGGIKTAGIEDPFGNYLGLIENPVFDIKACS